MYSAVFLNCVDISDILCVTIFLCNAKGCSIANFRVISRLQFWAVIFLLKDTKVQSLDRPISIVPSEFWPRGPNFLFRWNIFRNLADQGSEIPHKFKWPLGRSKPSLTFAFPFLVFVCVSTRIYNSNITFSPTTERLNLSAPNHFILFFDSMFVVCKKDSI